jgi:hypothetical protein
MKSLLIILLMFLVVLVGHLNAQQFVSNTSDNGIVIGKVVQSTSVQIYYGWLALPNNTIELGTELKVILGKKVLLVEVVDKEQDNDGSLMYQINKRLHGKANVYIQGIIRDQPKKYIPKQKLINAFKADQNSMVYQSGMQEYSVR